VLGLACDRVLCCLLATHSSDLHVDEPERYDDIMAAPIMIVKVSDDGYHGKIILIALLS
jgi:hypothetical protein